MMNVDGLKNSALVIKPFVCFIYQSFLFVYLYNVESNVLQATLPCQGNKLFSGVFYLSLPLCRGWSDGTCSRAELCGWSGPYHTAECHK